MTRKETNRLKYPGRLYYPCAEEVCDCPAFPWPHALLLSRRCAEQYRAAAEDYREEQWDAKWSEEERLDARSRAEEMRNARWP